MHNNMKNFFSNKVNLAGAAVGLISTISVYIWPANSKVPSSIVLILSFIIAICIWYIYIQKLEIHNKKEELSITKNKLNNIEIIQNLNIIECSNNRCFCKNNELVVINSFVLLIKQNHLRDVILGYGIVETITTQNIVQIKILNYDPYQFDNFDKIFQYINDNRTQIIVKPTITIEYLKEVML